MINSTNNEYEVTRENDLAYILSRFNQDYVYITVSESLKNKLRNYSYNVPNLVAAKKQEFEVLKSDYNNLATISEVEAEVYKNIISLICQHYNLEYNPTENDVDYYLIAFCLYDLLVSNFQNNVVNFFVNFITFEKESLYKILDLNSAKRNKDTSTIYSKKVFKDIKLGVISANLEYVVQSICSSIDIDFATYVNFVYCNDTETIEYILDRVRPFSNLFVEHVASIFNYSEFRPVLLTSIRLKLQTILGEDSMIDSMEIIKQGE